MTFTVERRPAGQAEEWTATHETAWLLLSGRAQIRGALEAEVARSSLFDELPWTLHVPAETTLSFSYEEDTEWLRFETEGGNFAPRVITPEEVRDEHRGQGALRDASYRKVRTIFDNDTSPKEARLVLGEVVNFPGRWSSYPPHHHNQPEIYHYRFTKPQGYGHAELGEDVLKVRHGDTVRILNGVDHPQCAAPGYGMWYAWAIRHLEGERYQLPTFTEEHRWTMAPDASHWWPEDLD